MIQACLYLRSSKDRADVSIDAQRRELQAIAKARGMTITAEFKDVVESGKDEFREGFQSLLRELQAPSRAWTAILVLDTSRIGRRRYIAQMFARECEKRRVTVVFAKVPDVDPISMVILNSVLQAMDEVHSLMSREKGIAGMAENVRQGYRAGGVAPRGYQLKAVTTGAVRDGQAVTKSKLIVSDDAPAIQKYLRARAHGTPLREAAAAARLALAETTLIGIEFNALVYSGATVWNVHAEQYKEKDETGKVRLRYKGGAKRRPRADWIIQPDTHEALITRAEAETILAHRESMKRRQRYQTRSDYLLGGLLTTPAGQAWHGGAGYYRSPDRSVKMESVDRAVLAQLLADLTSEPFVNAVVKRSHDEADAVAKGGEHAALDKQLADVNRRLARLASIIEEGDAPRTLVERLQVLEGERTALETRRAEAADTKRQARQLKALTAADVRGALRLATENLEDMPRPELKSLVRSVVSRIDLNAESLSCQIHYRLNLATGELMASPTGFEPVLLP